MEFVQRNIPKLSRSRYDVNKVRGVSSSSMYSAGGAGGGTSSELTYSYIENSATIDILASNYIYITVADNPFISITMSNSNVIKQTVTNIRNNTDKDLTITNSMKVLFDGVIYEANQLSFILYPSAILIALVVPNLDTVNLNIIHTELDGGT